MAKESATRTDVRNARDRYVRIFGAMKSLSEPEPWTTGVSNMLEWLTWSTNYVLGIAKTRYWRKVAEWSHAPAVRSASLAEKLRHVEKKLAEEIRNSEKPERYDPPESKIASPREALRRAKFHSEEYLNKEFDIFWTLVSDRYLDEFYGRFTVINGGGEWATHGNSGFFAKSTGIREMQMDNVAYNKAEGLLVANELKVRSERGPDQILKYGLMHKLLTERGFVERRTRLLLLFISATREEPRWDDEIRKEIEFCKRSSKSTHRRLIAPQVIEMARRAEKASTTWQELLAFNEAYQARLGSPVQQVEQKLLGGFNRAVESKAFMNRSKQKRFSENAADSRAADTGQ